MSATAIELRCPVGPRKLLGRSLLRDDIPPVVVDGNLMEVACRDCSRTAKQNDPSIVRVLHRFNILGELVESEAVWD